MLERVKKADAAILRGAASAIHWCGTQYTKELREHKFTTPLLTLMGIATVKAIDDVLLSKEASPRLAEEEEHRSGQYLQPEPVEALIETRTDRIADFAHSVGNRVIDMVRHRGGHDS
jgi:hypothetical protein